VIKKRQGLQERNCKLLHHRRSEQVQYKYSKLLV
jgi:hypothetical protein